MLGILEEVVGTSIFIKTWKNDLKWLRYCLQAINRYCSGFDEIVIAADAGCADEVRMFSAGARVESVEEWPNGYIQQQWFKLNADRYVTSEYILFVDSDTIFHTQATPETFFRDGSPVFLRTRYTDLGDSHVAKLAQKWRWITQSYVGWDVEWEYMRRIPIIVRSSTLKNIREMLPDLEQRLMAIDEHQFSEFNVIGAYIDKKEPGQYFITNTLEWDPPLVAEHFWSYSGLTTEERTRIEGYLNAG